MGISSTLASNKATQQTQPILLRTFQDEGFSSRRCSGCHSLRFRCALEGWREVLGRQLEGWLEERPRGEVHGRPVRVHLDLQRRRDSRPGCQQRRRVYWRPRRRQGLLNMASTARRTTSAGTLSSRTSGVNTSLRLTLPPTFTRRLQARPVRLAFPNPVPVGDGKKRISIGCMMGPYETGIVSNGQDTGAGFTVKQIEDNPSAFFTDVHSSLAV